MEIRGKKKGQNISEIWIKVMNEILCLKYVKISWCLKGHSQKALHSEANRETIFFAFLS